GPLPQPTPPYCTRSEPSAGFARWRRGRMVGRIRSRGDPLMQYFEHPRNHKESSRDTTGHRSKRTAVAFGFRRSLARHGGRSLIALVSIVVVGQAGLISGPSVAGPVAAAAPAAAAPARIAVAAHDLARPSDLLSPARADLAVFDAPTATADPAAADPAASDAAALAGAPAAEADDPAAGLEPSIQFEEAERHANDTIAFAPGGRVTIGFEPRAGDPWTVGGGRPVGLPAGRLDGKAMRAQPNAAASVDRPAPPIGRGGPSPAPAGQSTDAPVDLPSGGSTPIEATAVTFETPAGSGATLPTVQPEAAISAAGLRREIFGFLPY